MVWVIASGVYNLGFGLFHLAFWRLLKWREQLPNLSATNQAVVQALNLSLTFFFFAGASLYFAYPTEIRSPGIGKAVGAAMLVFWLFRTVQQLILFDLKRPVHQILLGLFLVGVSIHAAALWL